MPGATRRDRRWRSPRRDLHFPFTSRSGYFKVGCVSARTTPSPSSMPETASSSGSRRRVRSAVPLERPAATSSRLPGATGNPLDRRRPANRIRCWPDHSRGATCHRRTLDFEHMFEYAPRGGEWTSGYGGCWPSAWKPSYAMSRGCSREQTHERPGRRYGPGCYHWWRGGGACWRSTVSVYTGVAGTAIAGFAGGMAGAPGVRCGVPRTLI